MNKNNVNKLNKLNNLNKLNKLNNLSKVNKLNHIDENIINKKELFNWDDIINNNEEIIDNKINLNKKLDVKQNNILNNKLNNKINNKQNNKLEFNPTTKINNILDKNIDEENKETRENNKFQINKKTIFDKISILNKNSNIINKINEDELETKLDINKINVNSKLCINCNSTLFIDYNQAICINCGFENNNDISFDNDNTYIDSSYTNNEFSNLKVTGKNSYNLQKNMLKVCSHYYQYRKIHIMKEIYLWNNNSIDFKMPKHIMREGIEMFCKIKDANYVFRKDNKKGVISACLYYACYNNGIIKTPQEMAKYVGIQEKFHSYGDRVLHDLNDKGIIIIPNKLDSIPKYIDKYLELLNIDKKYKTFIISIINKLEESNVHLLYDSKNNTKCIGTIYLLIQRIPSLKNKITKELIEKECKISKTTFIRYYKIINLYYKKIKYIFKRHSIPMPVDWKN